MSAASGLLETIRRHPRCRVRNDRPILPESAGSRCVVYWMQRAQRGSDNPAFDAAIFAANELSLPLAVFFAPVPFFPRANERHYAFLFEGIEDLRTDVEARGATFVLRCASGQRIDAFAREVSAAMVIGDENALRETEAWRSRAAKRLDRALVTVDADVVVPTSLLPNEEYAAYTIRPKILRVLDEWLTERPEPLVARPFSAVDRPRSDVLVAGRLPEAFTRDRSATRSRFHRGGSRAAEKALDAFVAHALEHYVARRNRPELQDGTSRLSMYLHFGHLGPRRIARRVLESEAPPEAKTAFVEQLVVRRELAINFVLRNPNYDSFACATDWAKKTLEPRRADTRPHSYSKEELELGKTTDPLWNAAQMQMRIMGHMHNHMRMYWAKKLLEWSPSPEEAFAIAIEFNDRYELDGRDPNGYAGIAWAIAGKHDRPFAPGRPVFGTIRPMTLASTGRKFDSKRYIAEMSRLSAETGTTT